MIVPRRSCRRSAAATNRLLLDLIVDVDHHSRMADLIAGASRLRLDSVVDRRCLTQPPTWPPLSIGVGTGRG
jgi:hypothetical protein